jgi:enamine deaminase RidA (YjgF/YER057c/UK114 family)
MTSGGAAAVQGNTSTDTNTNTNKETTMSIQRIQPGKRLSRAVIHNGVAYMAGTTAPDRKQDIRGQVKQVFARLDEHMAEAGTDKSHMLNALIVLKDCDRDFAAMNEEWEAWVPEGSAPARATIQAALAFPDILVEIIVTAAVK